MALDARKVAHCLGHSVVGGRSSVLWDDQVQVVQVCKEVFTLLQVACGLFKSVVLPKRGKGGHEGISLLPSFALNHLVCRTFVVNPQER